METTHVIHEIEPVFNEHSQVLLLGTMPSPKSREQGFFYGHPQNRFWKVLASLSDEPLPETIEEKSDLCLRHHIALWDVLASCDIEGASDASIKNAQPNNLRKILKAAPIQAVFTTGTKAGQLYKKLCEPTTRIPCEVLPSTSPANSRMRLPELCEIYQQALLPYLNFAATYPILDVAEVVALEQSIAQTGTSLYTLMHRAGRFLAYETEKVLNSKKSNRTKESFTIALLCGHGNNGGDGWVAAQYLANKGYKVCLISSVSAHEIKAEPAHRTACEIEDELATCTNATIITAPTNEQIKEILSTADCIIDAILGTGFSGNTIREPFASWITYTNEAKQNSSNPPLIVAADVASGFSAQTGSAATPCVKADHTVTMITLKTGLATPQAKEYCGSIRVAPLADISNLL